MICLAAHFHPLVSLNYLFLTSILSAFLVYLGLLSSYIIMKAKFAEETDSFRSPVGVVGAIWSILVFTLGVIAVCGYQRDNHVCNMQ
jgi:putative copper export protein